MFLVLALGCSEPAAVLDTATPSDTEDTGAPDSACADGDADGICDFDDDCPDVPNDLDSDGDGVPDCEDACPGSDDGLDTDSDGVADCLDPCPADPLDDSDGDGVCDSDDECPGIDDALGCDKCKGSGGYALEDTDGDGLPDDCVLSVLLATSEVYTSSRVEDMLLERGWDVDALAAEDIDGSIDFSQYDVVAITFDAALSDISAVVEANDAKETGLLIHRGNNEQLESTDMGIGSTYQEGDCSLTAEHFITEPLGLGPVDLGYTYKSYLTNVADGVLELGSCQSGVALAVHPTHRRVFTPWYGHDDGMPWSAEGELIDLRSYAWAAGFGS